MLEILLPVGALTTIFLGNNSTQVTFNVHSTDWVLFAQSMRKIQPIVRKTISKIAQYGEAVERCEQVAASRPLPDESVIKHLRNYSIEDVRVFLITRSSLALEVCEKPELTELAYAIAVLEGADVSGTPKDIVQNIKLLVVGESTWGLKKKYIELPTSIQNILKQTDYFDKPFDDMVILDAIENAKKP